MSKPRRFGTCGTQASYLSDLLLRVAGEAAAFQAGSVDAPHVCFKSRLAEGRWFDPVPHRGRCGVVPILLLDTFRPNTPHELAMMASVIPGIVDVRVEAKRRGPWKTVLHCALDLDPDELDRFRTFAADT